MLRKVKEFKIVGENIKNKLSLVIETLTAAKSEAAVKRFIDHCGPKKCLYFLLTLVWNLFIFL
jgi:hypothetical protein